MGEGRGVHRVLVGKPEGKRPLGRLRRRWEDNIEMDPREVGGVETGWSWLRIGTDGGHLWIWWWTFGFHKVRGISWLAAEPVSFSRTTLLHGVSTYNGRRTVPQIPFWGLHGLLQGRVYLFKLDNTEYRFCSLTLPVNRKTWHLRNLRWSQRFWRDNSSDTPHCVGRRITGNLS